MSAVEEAEKDEEWGGINAATSNTAQLDPGRRNCRLERSCERSRMPVIYSSQVPSSFRRVFLEILLSNPQLTVVLD